MKVTIEYKYYLTEPHFWAISEINGEKIFSGGASWADAKDRHIEKLTALSSHENPPAPEVIEI